MNLTSSFPLSNSNEKLILNNRKMIPGLWSSLPEGKYAKNTPEVL